MGKIKYSSIDELPDLNEPVVKVDPKTKEISQFKSVDDLPPIDAPEPAPAPAGGFKDSNVFGRRKMVPGGSTYNQTVNEIQNRTVLKPAFAPELNKAEDALHTKLGGKVASPDQAKDLEKNIVSERNNPAIQYEAGDAYLATLGMKPGEDVANFYQQKKDQLQKQRADAKHNYDAFYSNTVGASGSTSKENWNKLGAYQQHIDDLDEEQSTLEKYASLAHAKKVVASIPAPTNEAEMPAYLQAIGANVNKLEFPDAVQRHEQDNKGELWGPAKEVSDIRNYQNEAVGINAKRTDLIARMNEKQIDPAEFQSQMAALDKVESTSLDRYPAAKIKVYGQALGQIIDEQRGEDGVVKSAWNGIFRATPTEDEAKKAINTLKEKGATFTPAQENLFLKNPGLIQGTAVLPTYILKTAEGFNKMSGPLARLHGSETPESEAYGKAAMERFSAVNPNKQFEQPETIIDTNKGQTFLKPVENQKAGQLNWGYGTGQGVAGAMATVTNFIIGNKAFGALAKASGLGTTGQLIASNVATNVALTYDDGKEAAKAFTKNPAEQKAYALISGALGGLLFAKLDPEGIIKKAFTNPSKKTIQSFLSAIPKEGIEAMKPQAVGNFVFNTAKNAIANNLSASTILTANELKDVVVESLFNPQSAAEHKFDIAKTFAHNAIMFGPLSLLHGRGVAIESKNRAEVINSAFEASKDVAAFKTNLQAAVQSGKIKPEDAAAKLDIVTKLAEIRNSKDLPKVLPENKQAEYAVNLLNEKQAEQQISELTDKVQIEPIKEEVKVLQEERRQMLQPEAPKVEPAKEEPVSAVSSGVVDKASNVGGEDGLTEGANKILGLHDNGVSFDLFDNNKLREIAKENGIDLPEGAKNADIIEALKNKRNEATAKGLENLSEKDFDKLTPSQKVVLYKEHGITKEDGSPITEKDIENSPLQYSYDFMAYSDSGKWNSANSELESAVQGNRKQYSLYKLMNGEFDTFKEFVDFINSKNYGDKIEYTDRMKRADDMSPEERKAAVDSYNKSVEDKVGDKSQKEKDILDEHGLKDETEYSPHELVEKFPLKGVQKVIWDIISPIVKKLGIKVKFSSSRITEGFDGSSNPMNGEVLLRPSTLKNGRLGEVLVHEVVHSLTTKIISRVNSGVETGLTSKQVAAVKGLGKLYKSIEADNNLQNKYPVKDIFEFIAHLTNDTFVKELQSKDRNFIQKVVDFISDILGLSDANELAKKYLKDIIHDGTFLEKEGITVVSSDYAANVKGAEGLTPKQRLLEAIKNNSKTTAEKYHDLKSKGKENDFTKAVEQYLSKQESGEQPKSQNKPIQNEPASSTTVNSDAKAAIEEIKAKNLTHVEGTGMGAKQADGMHISTEANNRYAREDKPAKKVTVDIQNPKVTDYTENMKLQHEKLKEIVDTGLTREDISTEYWSEIPKDGDISAWYKDKFGDKINEEVFSERARANAAKKITEQYKAEGYDALYFPESKGTEGELIVFDRDKVSHVEEKAPELPEGVHYQDKNGNQVITKDGMKTVINKKGVEVSDTTKNKVLAEHAEKIDFTAGDKAPEFTEPTSDVKVFQQHVVKTSSNPAELVEVYDQNHVPEELSSVEQAIANHGIGKIKADSFKMFDDRNNIGMSLAKSYFDKTGKSLDQAAQEISNKTGVEVSPEDVANFMKRFPNGQDVNREKPNAIAKDAAARFEEITGLKLTKGTAELVRVQKAEKDLAEKGLREEQEAIAKKKINADIAEQIIKDEGLTLENIDENEHLFKGLYSPEEFIIVKDYLHEQGENTAEPGATGQEGTGSDNNSKANTESPEKTSSENDSQGRIKELQSAFEKAKTELSNAEEKLAKEQGKQADMFAGGQQAGMFKADPNEAKAILDPLKQKVKEAKAALDKANKEAGVAADGNNPDIFPDEAIANKIDEKQQKDIVVKNGIPWGDTIKKIFTSNRGLPEYWMVLKDLATGERQLASRNMRKAIFKLQDAVKKTKYTDTDKISAALKDTSGTDFLSLPTEVQSAVKAMRLMVDGYSERLVNDNLVTPSQALIINDNIGEYLNRAYKLYTDKNWIKKVDDRVKRNAIQFLTQQRLVELSADPANAALTPAELLDKATQLGIQDATDILTKKDTPTGQRYTEQFSKDLSTLQKRTDIPEPIRKLMGEYTDPVTQFALTVSKMATLHSQAKLLNGLKDSFKGELFFEKDDVRPEGFNYKVADEGSGTWNPLNGLYTSKNVIDAIQESANTLPAWQAVYQKVFGTVKKLKTIYSIPTQVVNFFANPFISLANGHFNLGHLNKSWDYYKDTMFNKESGSDAILETLIQRNVIGQSVDLRQIRDMLRKDKADEFALEDFIKPKQSNWNPLTWAKEADKLMQKQYGASDSFWKVYGFMNEAANFSDALYDKKYKDLADDEKNKVDEMASERIKNTYPTYDRALPALMWVGKNIPFVGNFMAFQAEVLRTIKNNVLYVKEDLSSSNPKIKQMGAKRLAGLISYTALKQGMNYAAVLATGNAVSTLWAYAFQDDDKKSKRSSLDKFAPDFLQTHNLMVENAGPGKYTVYDIDRLDPYNAAWQSINALKVGKDGGGWRALREAAGPFIEPDMLLRAGMDINKNEDFQGKPIYNTAASEYAQFMQKMAYVYRVVEPTTAKMFKRAADAPSPTKEIAASLFGARSYTIDVQLTLKSKIREAEEKISSNGYFNYKDKEGKEKETMKSNFKKAVLELKDYYDSAIKLGVPPDEAETLIDNSFRMIGGARIIKDMVTTGNVDDADIEELYKKKDK